MKKHITIIISLMLVNCASIRNVNVGNNESIISTIKPFINKRCAIYFSDSNELTGELKIIETDSIEVVSNSKITKISITDIKYVHTNWKHARGAKYGFLYGFGFGFILGTGIGLLQEPPDRCMALACQEGELWFSLLGGGINGIFFGLIGSGIGAIVGVPDVYIFHREKMSDK